MLHYMLHYYVIFKKYKTFSEWRNLFTKFLGFAISTSVDITVYLYGKKSYISCAI